ncbi:MAG: RHS repeat-associated core domain-containing protein [Bacteroidetes bacterium]|nr:RHS repeat-associated core domain-containing protein [Bacteroidota bacterium]
MSVQSSFKVGVPSFPEAGQYCFDLIGGSGNYSLELFSGAEDFFILEAFTMSQSCEVEELIADVLNSNDYYPFGMVMPGRSYQGGDGYRYGFNGMEKDDEVKGNGNSYDFGARIYDPRVGRFLSIDPRWRDFSFMSPYVFAANNPIRYIDYNGEGPVEGPFTGKAIKTNAGLRVLRTTTAQRVMFATERQVVYALTGWFGAVAATAEAANSDDQDPVQYALGVVNPGTVQGASDLLAALSDGYYAGEPWREASAGPVSLKGGTKLLRGGLKGLGFLSIPATALDNAPTRKESLEAATFNLATKLMRNTALIPSQNEGGILGIYDKEADAGMVESGLNAIYNTLDRHLMDFDLTTEEGISGAQDYISNNYEKIKSDIQSALQADNENE